MSVTHEPVCFACSTGVLRGVLMNDEAALDRLAREFIQGILLGVDRGKLKVSIRSFKPPQRRGTCVVERCARFVETPCGACLGPGCQRCAIAADLRAARERIHADRDAELAELGVDDEQLETFVDQVIANLCAEHAPLGPALARHWYERQGIVSAEAAVGDGDAPRDS